MSNPVFKGYYNAKLLLSAEYLVLAGAKALAVPLRFGQQIEVYENEQGFISWNSIAHNGNTWFSAKYAQNSFDVMSSSDKDIAVHPQKLLKTASLLNPEFLLNSKGCHLDVTLNYPIEWGIGSSSTLIAAIAFWANVDPFQLHFSVSSGSGYDIACAFRNQPLIYSVNNQVPSITEVNFNPEFAARVFFVYQGVKKDSAEGIKQFKNLVHKPSGDLINQSNILTTAMLNAQSLSEFEIAMRKHEAMISVLLNVQPIKNRFFQDLPGEAKSLGAWGGDFCMITWNDDLSLLPKYLHNIGMNIFFNFSNIVLL